MLIELDFAAVLAEWPLLAKGVVWTLGLTAVSAVLGVALGVACAWARTQGPTPLRWVAGAYAYDEKIHRNTAYHTFITAPFGRPRSATRIWVGSIRAAAPIEETSRSPRACAVATR